MSTSAPCQTCFVVIQLSVKLSLLHWILTYLVPSIKWFKETSWLPKDFCNNYSHCFCLVHVYWVSGVIPHCHLSYLIVLYWYCHSCLLVSSLILEAAGYLVRDGGPVNMYFKKDNGGHARKWFQDLLISLCGWRLSICTFFSVFFVMEADGSALRWTHTHIGHTCYTPDQHWSALTQWIACFAMKTFY